MFHCGCVAENGVRFERLGHIYHSHKPPRRHVSWKIVKKTSGRSKVASRKNGDREKECQQQRQNLTFGSNVNLQGLFETILVKITTEIRVNQKDLEAETLRIDLVFFLL